MMATKLWCALAFFILLNFHVANATRRKRTNFWPTPPFVDGCDGLPQGKCKKLAQCGWYETFIPWCYDKRYIQVKPLPNLRPQEDVAKRFFEYSNGVHLSEGTAQKIYYNTDHEECGELCIGSALMPLNIRCLSFDFYEFPTFELPDEQPKPNRGICVLNDNSNEAARLRNVDQGYTDEELFSIPTDAGHYRLRLSNFGGHYAVRDPRGGQLAKQLDYPVTSPLDLNKVYIWGKSRWGIAHIPPFEPNALQPRSGVAMFNCSTTRSFPPAPPPSTQLTFYGGYTPVSHNQKCVGKLTKAQAETACFESGGFLCPDQTIAKSLEGRKIGCSYDKDPVWSAMDVPTSVDQKKFVRCCAKYSYPNFCAQQYSAENIQFCNKFKTFKDCQQQGTGYTRQNDWGFGRLLQSYREACVKSSYHPNKCIKAMVQDWAPRDRCIWCLEPGTGRGQCRSGNDFGICQSSSPESRERFANIMNSMCGAEATCRVSNAYPDLACFLSGECTVTPPDTQVIVPCASYSFNQPLCNANSEYCEWIPSSKRCLSRSFDEAS